MRLAELIMAIAMAVLSVYVMGKSMQEPIGWLKGVGPGGGAFPFWLAVGMLLSCIVMVVNWIRKTSPPSRSTKAYMSRPAVKQFAFTAGSLFMAILLFHFVGVYVSIPLFLIVYMRVQGRHSWRMCAALAFATTAVIFFFFEILLSITLPKGITEPLFYPIFDFFY
jgi:putative tricarboxylic transport membrane protein